MAVPAPRPGYKRQWVRCKTCGNVAYYDFIPFSLSNPVMTQPCGHGVGLRPNEKWDYITADEAITAMAAKRDRK